MSCTYYASAVRFQKRYKAPTLTPTSSAYTASVAAWHGLQAEPWYRVAANKVAVLTPHETAGAGEPADREYYDAYELCAEHAAAQHRCYAGMTAYRISLPDAAAGLSLESLSVSVSCDPYNRYGARLALAASASASPSDDWGACREGVASASGVAPRTTSTDGTLWYGATADATISPAGGLELQKYLWVFLSLENYQRSRNGWLEGSAILTPVFTLTLGAAIDGYDSGSAVGGGYGDEDAYVLSAGGIIIAPEAGFQADCKAREIALQSVCIGHSTSRNDPPSADAKAALPVLLARIAAAGMEATDMASRPLREWTANQIGLSCSIVRRIIGASAPFEQRLELVVAPVALLCALPVDYAPSVVRLTRRAGDGALPVSGADVRLSVYWAPSQAVSLSGLSAFFALPSFAFGGDTLTAGGATAELIGSAELPAGIPDGGSIAIRISGITDRWGTLMIVPWIARVTASELAVDEPVGLVGVDVSENEIAGAGWVPDIQMEV
jgi:hypothetical protein